MMKDETGKRYGRLTVLDRVYYPSALAYWRCKCDCGNTVMICGVHLRDGRTKSCGCLRKETAAATGRASRGQSRPRKKKETVK